MDHASLPESPNRRKDRSSFQVRHRKCRQRRHVIVLDIEWLMIEESKSGVNIKTDSPAALNSERMAESA
jgi:hypothetical protein